MQLFISLCFIMGMSWIQNTRLEIAASALGNTQVLIDACRGHVGKTALRGQPRADSAAIRKALADIEIELYAARQLTYATAAKVDAGADARIDAATAKMYAVEMAHRAIDTAIEIHGTIGITQGFPFERYYRDARVLRIADGTGEILRHMIARHYLQN